MNRHANLQVVALAVALVAAAPAARGQDHQMITPGDLKWADQPSLPPGAQIAVIEGKTPEEPYTGCAFQRTTRFRRIGTPPSSV